MGGVSSLNYNLVNNSTLIKNFHSKVILIRAEEDDRPLFLDKFNVDEEIVFKYSGKENQYVVAKRLANLLGTQRGVIVCDNLITMQAAAYFNNPKTVIHFIHDFFYVKQNILAGNWVDAVLCHSTFFADCVFSSDPTLFAERNFYIPYGVKQISEFPEKDKGPLNLVFLGRLDEGKGAHLLYEINKKLKGENIEVNWTIIGKGPLKDQIHNQWKAESNVHYCQPDSTQEVYDILAKQDIFVFPTSFEGTPVSILECLANGVVTIVSDLPGGIRDIVTDKYGFRVKLNDSDEFADKIIKLNNNRELLKEMQHNCFKLGNDMFDIDKNSDKYFSFFQECGKFKRTERHTNYFLSRLDKPYIPGSIVKLIRKVKSLV